MGSNSDLPTMQPAADILKEFGIPYEIDVVSGSCTCPFYAKHAGKHGCKHLLGYKKLLNEQEALA